MFSNGQHQDAFANSALVDRDRSARYNGLAQATGDKRGENERGNCAEGGPAAGSEPPDGFRLAEKKIPPMRALFRQAGRDLLPHSLSVIFSRFRDRNGVDGGEQCIDADEFCLAFWAIGQMCGDSRSVFDLAVLISDQLCFFRMPHSCVPMAFACPRRSTSGSSALRSFWTERNTVFFAALALEFRAPAISSIPEPFQWRITKAVRSAGVRSRNAWRICAASWPLCASRSGEGAVSGTELIKSISKPSSVSRAGRARFESSLFLWRMRSMA